MLIVLRSGTPALEESQLYDLDESLESRRSGPLHTLDLIDRHLGIKRSVYTEQKGSLTGFG